VDTFFGVFILHFFSTLFMHSLHLVSSFLGACYPPDDSVRTQSNHLAKHLKVMRGENTITYIYSQVVLLVLSGETEFTWYVGH
jgi:hypothetical protein